MAEAEYESSRTQPDTKEFSLWGMGLIFTAIMLMVFGGSLHFLQGLTALLSDDFYRVRPGYDIGLSVTAWGWLQIVIGTVMALAGMFLLTGALWARLVAIGVTFLSAIGSFYSIPYYPVWSILMLALEIAILWALLAHGRDFAEASGEG
jgi:hypothetical protein